MLQRLHGSPTAHGYRALSGDGHSHSHMSYASPPAELSHDGTGTLHYAPSKGTLTSSKSFGDIRAMAGRQRTKKSRSVHRVTCIAMARRWQPNHPRHTSSATIQPRALIVTINHDCRCRKGYAAERRCPRTLTPQSPAHPPPAAPRAMRWLVLGSDGDRKYFSLDKRQLIQVRQLRQLCISADVAQYGRTGVWADMGCAMAGLVPASLLSDPASAWQRTAAPVCACFPFDSPATVSQVPSPRRLPPELPIVPTSVAAQIVSTVIVPHGLHRAHSHPTAPLPRPTTPRPAAWKCPSATCVCWTARWARRRWRSCWCVTTRWCLAWSTCASSSCATRCAGVGGTRPIWWRVAQQRVALEGRNAGPRRIKE